MKKEHSSARMFALLALLMLPWAEVVWAKPHGPRHKDPRATQYTLRDIGPDFMRGGFVQITDLEKDQDIVIGIFDDSGYPHAIEVFPTPHDIGPRFSRAISIDGTRVVGFIGEGGATIVLHATVWENGVPRDLGFLDDNPNHQSVATCINEAGDIWGFAPRVPVLVGPSLPLLWAAGGPPIALPTFGGQEGRIAACNDVGDSAGIATTPSEVAECAFWPVGGGVVPCHPTDGATESRAVDLNQAGELVANASQAGQAFAYRWHFPGAERLRPLHGDSETQVASLNDLGDAVGRSCAGPPSPFSGDTSHTCHAVLWQDGEAIDLLARTTNADGWSFTRAFAIGNDGAIVVLGLVGDAGRLALLTPVDTARADKPKGKERPQMPALARRP